MASIVLTAFAGGFNTDNFWAGRSAASLQATATTYDFLNVAGYFIRVTGTGMTYDNDDPLAGIYTDIGVYTDSGYTTLVDSYSSPTDLHFSAFFTDFATEALVGDDSITGSTGDDRMTGYGGADTMDGGDGSDTYVFATDDVVTGEQITDTGGGVGDIDSVLIGQGGEVNFSNATILGIEALTFEGSGTATFNASQPPSNLLVTGVDTVFQTVNVNMSGLSFSADGWSFADWGADGADLVRIFGTPGNDTITGSSQADIVFGSSGADALDGGDGSDSYQFTTGDVAAGEQISDTGASGVDVLALTGDIDFTLASAIYGIEQVSLINAITATFNASQLPTNLDIFAQAIAAQTLAIVDAASFSAAGWTFTNWDSSHTLSITGTTGDDSIAGSSQNDTMDGQGGSDTANYAAATNAVTVTLDASGNGGASGTGLGADTLTSFELFTTGSGGDTFHLAGSIGRTVNGGGGSDLASYAASASGVTIDIGNANGIGTDDLFFIDSVTGSTHADTFVMGDLADNSINGNGGIDTVSYAAAAGGGVIVNFVAHSATGAGIGTDTLTAIANVIGTGSDDSLTGDSIANALSGLGGNDTLDGGLGIDSMSGGAGNDTYFADVGADLIIELAGQGFDTVKSTVTKTLAANVEKLTLIGTFAVNGFGNGGINTIIGNAKKNILNGLGGNDTLAGNGGSDVLAGAAGKDALSGGLGFDRLVGGAGRDTMMGGGQRDIFDFNALSETGKTLPTRDLIKDFQHGIDDIDLSTIDAVLGSGNQKFTFIGQGAFSGVGGQLHYKFAGANTIVEGDVNGDRKADFQIELTGHKLLTAGDFIL